MSNNNAVIEFDVKLPKLSKNEKETLKLIIEAGRLVGPLYLEQEKDAKNSVSQKELEKAAKKNSDALSPYTVVQKVKGQIVVTPYHIKYVKLLKPIAEKLYQAAKINDNKEFADALKIQADALLDGSYEKAVVNWLKTQRYILDISIEPVEHLDDKLFFGKATYQCWIGFIDEEGTERFNNYKSVFLSARRKDLTSDRVENYDKVKARVLDVVLLSGLMAKTKFVGVNLPVNVGIVEKYGSEITLFNQPNDLRVDEQILPTFNKIFPKEFREGFRDEDLRRGYLRNVAMHELAHSYLYYRNAEKNLKEHFQSIYELAATVLGLRMSGFLLLKDRINEKQLESMIIAFMCRSVHMIDKSQENDSLINYAIGGDVFINYLLESGAIKQSGNQITPNFMKIFVSLHELSGILEKLLSTGTSKDAEKFIKKYSK